MPQNSQFVKLFLNKGISWACEVGQPTRPAYGKKRMTLIEVRNSDGLVGRCDARCYDAKYSNCTCICGGRNHNKGESQAVATTRETAEDLIDRLAADNPENKVRITDFVWQMNLI